MFNIGTQNDRIEKRKALTVAELADSFYEKRKIRIILCVAIHNGLIFG